MLYDIKYIELKTGYSDNGPAWIGRVKASQTGTTVYFNDKALKKRNGVSANYYDIETGDEYWISGVKKNGLNRHWAGNGKIMIDRKIVNDFLRMTNQTQLNTSNFEIVDIDDIFPVERIKQLENMKKKPG
jgi:hypothetical protein